jgi:hypothetical protein
MNRPLKPNREEAAEAETGGVLGVRRRIRVFVQQLLRTQRELQALASS